MAMMKIDTYAVPRNPKRTCVHQRASAQLFRSDEKDDGRTRLTPGPEMSGYGSTTSRSRKQSYVRLDDMVT